MKIIKSNQEFSSSKISKVQKVLDQTIFKRGCCQKMTLLLNFHLGHKIFHLLRNQELALKFQISDKEASLSVYHLHLKLIDKIML